MPGSRGILTMKISKRTMRSLEIVDPSAVDEMNLELLAVGGDAPGPWAESGTVGDMGSNEVDDAWFVAPA